MSSLKYIARRGVFLIALPFILMYLISDVTTDFLIRVEDSLR